MYSFSFSPNDFVGIHHISVKCWWVALTRLLSGQIHCKPQNQDVTSTSHWRHHRLLAFRWNPGHLHPHKPYIWLHHLQKLLETECYPQTFSGKEVNRQDLTKQPNSKIQPKANSRNLVWFAPKLMKGWASHLASSWVVNVPWALLDRIHPPWSV